MRPVIIIETGVNISFLCLLSMNQQLGTKSDNKHLIPVEHPNADPVKRTIVPVTQTNEAPEIVMT